MSLHGGQDQAGVDCGVTVGVHGRLRDGGVDACDDGTYVGRQFPRIGHTSLRVPLVSATRPRQLLKKQFNFLTWILDTFTYIYCFIPYIYCS